MHTDEYVRAIHFALAESPYIVSYDVVRERVASQEGLFHARIVLSNGDYLETSEFFISGPHGIETVKYRHQWMDSERKQLRKRWDNKQHFPNLPNFPYHCHDGSVARVVPSEPLSIIALLQRIQAEIELLEGRDS